MMIAANARRVSDNTPEEINDQIQADIDASIARCAAAGRRAIERRLSELDHEWDVERCVETLAPSLTLIGLGLGLLRDRRWLLLPVVVQGFFLQHALQGWCPPIPILRRLGVRTTQEIERERQGLIAIHTGPNQPTGV